MVVSTEVCWRCVTVKWKRCMWLTGRTFTIPLPPWQFKIFFSWLNDKFFEQCADFNANYLWSFTLSTELAFSSAGCHLIHRLIIVCPLMLSNLWSCNSIIVLMYQKLLFTAKYISFVEIFINISCRIFLFFVTILYYKLSSSINSYQAH